MEGITAGVIGIVIGALLSGFGYLVRVRRERNRIINESLFNLLEVWHQARLFTPFDIDEVLIVYRSEIAKLYPGLDLKDSGYSEIKKAINAHAKQLLDDLSTRERVDLYSSYCSAIGKLSSELPILAFMLNGHQNLKNRFDSIDYYFNKLKTLMDEDDSVSKEFVDSLIVKLSSDARVSIYERLEKDLLSLSSHLGFRIKHQVKNKIEKEREGRDIEIKELVTNVIQFIEMSSRPTI